MSTLIFQIDIGEGTQWHKESSINTIRKVFIPSVKKYAEKYGYDYKLITESEYSKQGGDFQFLFTKEKHFSLERYFHFAQDYDNIVYIDNDVYVFVDANPLPEIKGIMNVAEPENHSSEKFRQFHPQKLIKKYFNSGVTMTQKHVAHHLQDYMQWRIKNKLKPRGKNTDNTLLNEYILKYPEFFNEISNKWNYMPFLENIQKIRNLYKELKVDKPNFFHFVGILGKTYLLELLKQTSDIKGVLEDVIRTQK